MTSVGRHPGIFCGAGFCESLKNGSNDQRHQAQQCEQEQQSNTDQRPQSLIRQCLQRWHVGSCGNIQDRPRKHSQLADPPECAQLHRGEAHDDVDDKEGHQRNQPEQKQVGSSVPLEGIFEALKLFAEPTANLITEQKATGHEGAAGTGR